MLVEFLSDMSAYILRVGSDLYIYSLELVCVAAQRIKWLMRAIVTLDKNIGSTFAESDMLQASIQR